MAKLQVLAAAMLIVAAPVLAQTVAPTPVPAPVPPSGAAKAKSDMDKVVCRTQDTLGSRLDARQVCMTKQQWAEYEQDSKQKVHDMQVVGLQSH